MSLGPWATGMPADLPVDDQGGALSQIPQARTVAGFSRGRVTR